VADNPAIASGAAAMNEDRFLLSLITIVGRRGTRFVLRIELAMESCDNWLCLMAGVTPQQLQNGILTGEEVRKFCMAARMLDDVPICIAHADDDSPGAWSSYRSGSRSTFFT
jgi:hypothetical protein